MESSQFLQHLHESSLEEGRTYIQAHFADLTDHDAIAKLLEDEALKLLYNPFPSLKLAELLTFYGEITGHLPSHALGLKAKGDALRYIGHHRTAMECLDVAGEEFLSLGDEGNWARSRISWILAAAWLGDVEEALQAASSAREVFLRLGELYWVCIIDHNTAVIYSQIGRYQDALTMYERMLSIYPTLTDQNEAFIKRAIAMAEINQSLNLARLGQFEKAYPIQQKAQASFAALNEKSQVINAEIHLADFDYTQGYYGSALRRYYQAQEALIQNNIDNPRLLAEIKLQMADTLVKLSRADEACQLAYEAVEVYRQLDVSLQASNALREYANALVAAGRLQESLTTLNEAWTLFRQGGFHHHASATRLQMAELLLAIGSNSEAYNEASLVKEYFDAQGLVVARSVRASIVMVSTLIEQAQQAGRKREQEQQNTLLLQAVQLCKQTALQARQHHLQEEVYKSQYLLGQIFALQGNIYKAKWHYGAAIAQIERILDDLVYDLSPSFLRTAWKVYEDMIDLCLQQGQIALAFNHLERARSMALQQYLTRSKTSLTERGAEENSADSTVLQTYHNTLVRTQHELTIWQEKYRDYSVLLTRMDTTVSPSLDRGVIQAELKRCETKISALFERLYLQQTTHLKPQVKKAEKSKAKHLDIAHLQQCLSPHQLLLAYFLHKGKLTIFAVTPRQLVLHERPEGMKQLRRLLPLLHAHMQPAGWANPTQPTKDGSQQILKKLYDLLIGSLATRLPTSGGHIIVVPYGPLHTLPFHALYDGSHFLIENFQVSYLPAASLLQTDIYEHEQQGPGTETAVQPLIFGYSGRGHLQRALEEAKTLAAMLNGRCYIEDEATIARLIAEAPGSPIIHVATHGHSRLDAPNFSSILLADGRFNAIDAFSLDLKACELVTLSGCETGLALSGGGDEQLGLGRAFLAARAKSLVMSLWPVEDNATSELMQSFYQNLLDGESKVQALRAAQCSLIQRTDSSYAHPYYWAAFRLVGNIAALKYRRAESCSPVQQITS